MQRIPVAVPAQVLSAEAVVLELSVPGMCYLGKAALRPLEGFTCAYLMHRWRVQPALELQLQRTAIKYQTRARVTKHLRQLSLRALRQAELLRVIAIATQDRSYHHGHRARQIARAAHAPGERPRAEDGRDEAGGDDDARRVRQRRE